MGVLSLFGFGQEALPLLAVISVIIDPLATLLNATGDNAAALLVDRLATGGTGDRPVTAQGIIHG